VSRRLFLGAISGTSVDGLDVALLEDGSPPRILAGHTYALPDALRSRLLRLGQPGSDDLDSLGETDAALGRFIGLTIRAFLSDRRIDTSEIAAIGSHGQTVRHRPTATHPFTLQIGDPNIIAELSGITTVADFRRRDMAAGGQGAPLVPPFHQALFHSPEEDRVVLNIGGIANVTLLARDGTRAVTGFDTGPGNGLMDAWITERRGLPFDADGAWGSTGSVDRALLARLCEDPYFAQSPPKSTGREYFNLAWLRARLSGSPQDADVQATLRALTAETVRTALERWTLPPDRVLVCGGGRLNPELMAELRLRLPCSVEPVEALEVDGDCLEAAAFAWLAARTLNGLPGNEPAVTGANGYRVLGVICPA